MGDAERSWWLREALALPEFAGEPAPALATDIGADLLIIGGGYTGLWTAWQLKLADPGIDIVLVEQDICGGGPSGRNGGFVNGWYDHVEGLVELFGDAGALRVMEAGAASVREMSAWCEAQGVDAWFTLAGYLGVASSPAQEGSWHTTIAEGRRLGIGDRYRELSREGLASLCSSPSFGSGYHVAEGGTVQPARLARGLRRVVMEAGVRVYEGTPVTAFRESPSPQAKTPGGSITAGQAVLAVNAWASNWKQFRRTIVPRASYMAVTAPAPDLLERIGWTGGEAVYDMRATLRYFRTTPDGRIALGVGGERGTWSGAIGPHFAFDERGTRHAIEAIHRFFPSFRDVPIEGRWGGPIDVAGLHIPFFGALASGKTHYGFGYTGNGVGPAYLGGKILAARVLGQETEDTRLPFVDMEPKRFPPEPFRAAGAALINEATVRRDDALDAGRRPDPIVDQIARLPRRLGYHLGP